MPGDPGVPIWKNFLPPPGKFVPYPFLRLRPQEVKFAMQCRLPSRSFPVPRESDKSIQGRSV
jgi:hypothetical protein